MEFNLLNFGRTNNDTWIDLFVVKWGPWEPGLFKVHYHFGKWDWDLLGIGELLHYLKIKR